MVLSKGETRPVCVRSFLRLLGGKLTVEGAVVGEGPSAVRTTGPSLDRWFLTLAPKALSGVCGWLHASCLLFLLMELKEGQSLQGVRTALSIVMAGESLELILV